MCILNSYLFQKFIPFDLAVPFAGLSPKETVIDMHKDAPTAMFNMQLFLIPDVKNSLCLIIGTC